MTTGSTGTFTIPAPTTGQIISDNSPFTTINVLNNGSLTFNGNNVGAGTLIHILLMLLVERIMVLILMLEELLLVILLIWNSSIYYK